MKLNYEGRVFVSISNTGSGEVNSETRFEYHQRDDVVWATYAGGRIRFGTLIAQTDPEGNLDMRYSHLNTAGELATGMCQSIPEVLPDGRLRLHEEWQWTSGDCSKGSSVVEEVTS